MDTNKKTIAVLGASGSVGRQALDVARRAGYPVDLLAAHSSVEALEAAAREFLPRFCVLTDEGAARDLACRLADTSVQVLGGEAGLDAAIAQSQADTFINAILGKDGLMPSLAVLRRGARLALSNKESMVVAGALVKAEASRYGGEILPVDSEHSAIFQCLLAGNKREVKRLWLTASGGPFLGYTRRQLAEVTMASTLAHPTWQMGAKITVDSATLMNKGFEVIEAVHLFDVPADRVAVVVHPESIIHSCVEYIDNTVMAEMSLPDMRTCVQYAITYPERRAAVCEPLDLAALGSLTFRQPDREAFPALSLAYSALAMGGAAPAILNAADEVAVAAYLRGEIDFLAITEILEKTLAALSPRAEGLDEILEKDRSARSTAAALIQRTKRP